MPYLHRTLCDTLEELRKCDETKNYSYFLGLVEEAQSMANKMEASLGRKRNTIIELQSKIEELEEAGHEVSIKQ